jgi:hypothetical protein
VVERTARRGLEIFQKIIKGIQDDYVRADCPVHGKDVYFERVDGDLFQCANFEHKPLSERQGPPDPVPGRTLSM